MRRRLALLLTFIVISIGLPALPGQAQSNAWALEVLEADQQHLLLELVLPTFDVETITREGVQYQRLAVEGWGRWGQPGQPQLPSYSLPVGLPWPGDPQISILEAESEVRQGYYLYPAPQLALKDGGDAPEIVETFAFDAGAYRADADHPGVLAGATETGFLRHQPLFQLRLYPFQYNPVRRQLRVYHRLMVLITFPTAPPAPAKAGPAPASPVFERILARTLLNYEALPRPPVAPAQPDGGAVRNGLAANGATYLIITHPDFYQAAQGLAGYRAGRGETVAVVKTDDIYAQYSGDPAQQDEDLRSFLRDAYNTWSPQPVYVLLVGDASADAQVLPDFVPAHYEDVPLFEDAPNDSWYAKLSEDDIYPDVIIGRIPARSAADVTAVVNKVMAYEQSPPGGSWARRAVLVADNDDDIFQSDMETVAALLPGSVSPTRMYAYNGSSVESQIGGGALLFAYSGHGYANGWGAWPGSGGIFQKSNIGNMWNGNKLPFMTVANCANGYFADTQSPRVLAEEFLLIPNKGGIAAWAPSSYAFPSVNSPITEELFRALFVDNDLILGSAATTARLTAYLANSHLPLGLFEVFTYFGDPAVKLNLPATLELSGQDSPDPVVMGESITYSLAYTVSGAEEAPGLTLANTLPDHVTYQSASPPPSTVDGQVLTWNLGNVPGSPPSSGLVEITARLNTSGLAHNQQVINQAGLTDYFGGNGSLQMKTAALDAPIAGLAAGHDGPTFLGSQTTFTASTQAGSNVVYHWDFGDGSSGGQGASVQHTYVATGTYVAQVTATNGAGSDSATTTLKIRDIPPVAGFTSSAPDKIGQTSAFESTSSGTNLVYTWDFGDGSPPVSGQSPEVSHTYPLTGSYTAILTATNSEGSSTFSGTIDILQSVIPPLAGFTSSSPTPLFQMTVFTNTSRDGGEDPEGLTYLWDFGDGSPGSYEPHPGHLYANTGAYVVSLTIGNSAGEDVFSDTVNITAAPHTLLLPVIVKGSSP